MFASNFFIVALALCSLLFKTAVAADVPSPLEPLESRCVENSVVRVCQQKSRGASAMLTIDYHGSLSRFDPVSVWINLNGRWNTYRMKQNQRHATLFLTNGDIDCVPCSATPAPDIMTCPTPWLSDRWICTEAQREVRDLFSRAVDENSNLVPWNIELAFVSGNDWDSLYGANYRFRLP